MWAWFHVRYRRLRFQSRQWLNRHPRIDRMLHATGCLDTRDGAVARGVAVGLFVALIPLFGVQTLLIILGCIVMRGNFPAGFAVSWINNPLTVAPLYLIYHEIGETLFGVLPAPITGLSGREEELAMDMMSIGLGSLCVAAPVALGGYVLLLYAERALRRRRAAKA